MHNKSDGREFEGRRRDSSDSPTADEGRGRAGSRRVRCVVSRVRVARSSKSSILEGSKGDIISAS